MRLEHDQRRDDHQADAVDQRAEHLAALEAVGARRRRRDGSQTGGHERDPDRSYVGGEVAAVGEQRERVREDPADHGGREHRDVDRERHLHAPPVGRAAGVEMPECVVACDGNAGHQCSNRTPQGSSVLAWPRPSRLGGRGRLRLRVARAPATRPCRSRNRWTAPGRRRPSRTRAARRTQPSACAR